MDLLLPSLIDARADHPRHIQSQLTTLHRALSSPTNATRLCRSLAVTLTPAEAEAELALALDAVRHWHDSVDVARAHDDEYAVARGRSNPGRRVASGLVVVRRGAGVFGVVAAVAAAVRGGCCVVVEVSFCCPGLCGMGLKWTVTGFERGAGVEVCAARGVGGCGDGCEFLSGE